VTFEILTRPSLFATLAVSRALAAAIGVALCVLLVQPAAAEEKLLNASYDVSREFYKALNPEFAAAYKAETGKAVEIQQTHNGSSKQARAVIAEMAVIGAMR